MSTMNSPIFISVESRKGGVGKTTVCLALAQALLEKDYEVLVIDLDIFGTKLGDKFLEKQSFIKAVSVEGQPLNLVELYKDVFLKGELVPGLDLLDIAPSKCNYISSDIYSSSDGCLIEDPRIISDSLHSFWLKQLIQRISDSFVKSVAKNEKKGGIIIIDNAPGYSSLESMVHEALTTKGPERGKFIIVSSLDDQDIDAVSQSAKTIQRLLEEKVQGGLYYQTLCGNGKQPKIKSKYFDEIWKELCMTDGEKPEYFAHVESNPDSSNYIVKLINKFPKGKNPDDIFPSAELFHFVPYINSLQLLYCTSLTTVHDVVLSDMSLIGQVASILEDDSVYIKWVQETNEAGMDVFDPDWRPLGVFVQIMEYYQGQDKTILFSNEEALGQALESLTKEGSLNSGNESQLVRQYIVNLCGDNEDDSVFNEALKLIEKAGENTSIVWQTEKQVLRHNAEIIVLVGKAIYYLSNYSSICRLLNSLHKGLTSDSFEGLDKERISSFVESAVLGQKRFNEAFWKEWQDLLISKVNMREMIEKLNTIIEQWNL